MALALPALALPSTLPLPALHAQERPVSTQGAPAAPSISASIASTTSQAGPQGAAQLKQESKESSDSEDAIRHAPAVRWIAKHTGLSLGLTYWLCVILNFAVVVGTIFGFARKKLPVIFKNRSGLIQKRLEEARQAGKEAQRRLGDVEGRLSRLDEEIAAMQREAEENGQAEERRALTGAEEERARIVAAAEQEIAIMAGAARRELKAFAGALAVDLAEKKICVGQDADQTLVREFTAHLGRT